ncbi:hypothetical protein WA026_003101 [Henosepilachna vigintioctopunctata]|uniref:Uncharacterized protein n=1 Tax=Henosepilachna vigintioctopunctata TaxID=420089 RepID=A0AAW1THY3_9CUCU
MNEDYINEEGLLEAQTLLNSLGGWPVLQEVWDSNSFKWIEAIKLFKEKGLDFNFLLRIIAGKDFGDTSKRIIIIDQPSAFGLNTHILHKGIHDPTVKKYFELIVDTAIMFGADEFKASEEMHDALDFEIKLSNLLVSKTLNRNTSYFYNKMTLKELTQQYGSIDWMKLLRNIFPEEVKLYDEKQVLVEVPKYIERLERLLKTTSQRTIANYLFLRVVLEIYPFLPQKFEDRLLKFKKAVLGTSAHPPRWKTCFLLTDKHMSVLLGATYIRRFFNDDIKKSAAEMVKYIVTTFETSIKEETPWIDEKTKQRALEKAEAIRAHVAYDKELLDDNNLSEIYSGLHIMEKLFLQSFLNLNKLEWNRLLGKLLEPVEKNDWRDNSAPITVNAFYKRLDNSIIVPAAILQDIFFNKDRPSYLNYGAIGTIIGHEIVHAFDDEGSQFNKDGNLKNWWEEATKTAFIEKTKCFINKFNSIRVEEVGLNVSGERTVGENIADNGGAKQAYLAYNSWTRNYGEESKLPGLQYTPRQLFWIAGAQNWCSKERKEYLKQLIARDPHTPHKYRVNGNYQNLEFFAKDFKCPLGSNMNPRNKCSIW